MSGVHTDPRTKIFVLLICAVAIADLRCCHYDFPLALLRGGTRFANLHLWHCQRQTKV